MLAVGHLATSNVDEGARGDDAVSAAVRSWIVLSEKCATVGRLKACGMY
jgi:hypothetical protein